MQQMPSRTHRLAVSYPKVGFGRVDGTGKITDQNVQAQLTYPRTAPAHGITFRLPQTAVLAGRGDFLSRRRTLPRTRQKSDAMSRFSHVLALAHSAAR